MFNRILNTIENNPILSLMLPTGAELYSFINNLVLALADGKIDDVEWHQLLAGTSGLGSIALMLVMGLLKRNQSK